jgi:hypothetical protein
MNRAALESMGTTTHALIAACMLVACAASETTRASFKVLAVDEFERQSPQGSEVFGVVRARLLLVEAGDKRLEGQIGRLVVRGSEPQGASNSCCAECRHETSAAPLTVGSIYRGELAAVERTDPTDFTEHILRMTEWQAEGSGTAKGRTLSSNTLVFRASGPLQDVSEDLAVLKAIEQTRESEQSSHDEL